MDGSNTGSGECNYISESEYEDLGEDYNDDESDVDGEISNITEENDDVDNSDDDDGINNSDDGNSNDDASDSEGMANESSFGDHFLLQFILTIFLRIIYHFRISNSAASSILAFFSFVLGTSALISYKYYIRTIVE